VTRRNSSDYKALQPYIVEEIRRVVGGGGTRTTTGGGGLEAHALSNTSLHTGTLADSQALQFLKTDGSRPLTGNLAVADGVTIDGVDLSVHAADPNAHHAQVHGVVSGNHTLPVGTAAWNLIGATALNTLGLLLPLSDVTGATKEALLKSNSLGELAAVRFIATGSLRAPTIDTTTGDLQLAPASGVTTAASLHASTRLRTPLIDTAAGNLALAPATGITTLADLRASTRLRAPLIDTASGDMTIAPAADLLLQPGSSLVKLQSGVALQSHNYASQLTGMRITALGEGDFRYLFADEMHAKSFIADLEQALAGGQIISKSVAMLAANFTAPAAGGETWMYVKDLPSAPNMAVFESNDIICLRQFSRAGGALAITFCWGVVTSYLDGNGPNGVAEGHQRWTFTRSTAPNAGAMAGGAVIAVDSIVLDFGVSGNGYYEVNAIDGLHGVNSPYLRFVRWTGHPATGAAERVRLGNLRGIFNQDEYGLFAGTGTDNTDRYLRLSDYAAGNGINNLPFRLRNNGVTTVEFAAWNDVWMGPSSADKRFEWTGTALALKGALNILNSAGTPVITLDTAGGSYFAGVMTIGTAGEIRQGTGTLGSNYTGLRIWRDGGVGLIGGYNNNVSQWVADTSGRLTAGGGAVVLDANGETVYRPIYVSTAAIPEPGFGTLPNLSPTAAQMLEFRDTAETFYRTGSPASYAYPGNTLLRMFVSSNHHAPYSDPAFWSHYLDGVIEMPAITEAGDPNVYTRRLWLKAPLVVIDGALRVQAGSDLITATGGGLTLTSAAVVLRSNIGVEIQNLTGSAYQGIVTQFVASVSGNNYSDSAFTFFNAAGSAYQGIVTQFITSASGNNYSNSAFAFFNAAGNAAQNLRARSLLASNDYSHYSRVPETGIYSLGGVAIGTPGVISAGYMLDVNGAVRVRGSIALNAHMNLTAIAEPATSAVTGELWMGADNKLYFKKPSGTALLVAG
jgi:hypothetical protein